MVALLSPSAADAAVARHVLDSGVTLLVAPRAGAGAVAVQAWVGVGAADEPRRQAGIAHVFEHMLFKGTERRGIGEVAATIEAAGGDINAWTSFDDTVFHVVVARRHLDTALDVLGDALAHSSFDAGELEREREVVLEEIRQGQDDPVRAVAQNLFSTAFSRHPYRFPIIGEADTVRSLRRHHLLRFHRRWYSGPSVTVVVAGDVDPGDVRARAERHFAGLAPTAAPARRRVTEPAQAELRSIVAGRDVSEAQIALGFRLPPLGTGATAALDVAAVALGQGESSRLVGELLRERELVTSAQSYVHALRDGCLLLVSASALPGRANDAARALGAQLGRLAAQGLEAGEIAKAVHAIEADAVYQSETVEALARKAGTYHSLTRDTDFERRYLEAVRRVSADEVRSAARRYLAAERATLSAVLPESRRLDGERGRQIAGNRLAALFQRGLAQASRRAPRPAPAQADPDLVRARLPSGMQVIIQRDPSVPLVAARAVWPGGVRLETERSAGMSQLIGALLSRGCGERTAEEIIEEVDASASVLGGFSGRNSLGLRAEWLARDWERGFELFADCLLEPSFPADELAREKRRSLEDLDARDDSPSAIAFRLFISTLYRRHPYRLDPLGTPESLRAITRRRLVDHFRRHYPPGRMTLVIVGDVEPARALALVRARFGDAPAAPGAERAIPPERFAGRSEAERQAFYYLDRKQAQLVIGFPGITVDDPDRHALEVLTTVLGGQGGRLFTELRDRQALAYRIGVFSTEGLDPGYVAVHLACAPDKLPAAVAGIRAELDRVREGGVSAAELSRAQRYLIGTHGISLQRRASVAAALAYHAAYGLDAGEHARYAELVSAVTADDVRRVAERLFDWELAVTATVMPPVMSPEAARRARGTRERPRRRRR